MKMTNQMGATIDVGRKTIEVSIESGVVLGVRRLSETHVSGSVNNGSGNVSSTVVRTTEFALLGTDRIERSHHFMNHDVFLRDGNRVSLIHASYKGSGWAYLVNHDARTADNVWSAVDYVYHLGLVRKIGWLMLVIGFIAPNAIAGVAHMSKDDSVMFFWCVFGGLLVLKLIQRLRAEWMWRRHLRPALERIAGHLISTPLVIA
jgi:hypothetical protein